MTLKAIVAVFLSIALTGCGTAVPGLQEFYDPQDAQTFVEAVVEQVQCEVKTGVQSIILDDQDASAEAKSLGFKQEPVLGWLNSWGAQVTLNLTIDEKSSFNPGLSITPPIAPVVTKFGKLAVTNQQTAAAGLGATISADATRKETLSWLVNFGDFTGPGALANARASRLSTNGVGSGPLPTPCRQSRGILIQSDLKLRDWLYAVTLPEFTKGGIAPKYSAGLQAEATIAKNVISHEVTFVALYGGSITPAWKLLRVSIDQGSTPLFNGQRTRTQDLLITMGPIQKDGTLAPAAQNTVLANQIGVAVANAIRNNQ